VRAPLTDLVMPVFTGPKGFPVRGLVSFSVLPALFHSGFLSPTSASSSAANLRFLSKGVSIFGALVAALGTTLSRFLAREEAVSRVGSEPLVAAVAP
jgi:hypothetical protein